jgi:uncharacterized spore protein YtfJ
MEASSEGAAMSVKEQLQGAREAMTVRTVYGEPFTKDGVTVIPAARVRGGGGGGEGKSDQGEGEGLGFGLSAGPVGAWIVKDGEVSWKPAVDVSRTILGGQIVGVVALFVAWRIAAVLARRR